MLEPYLSENQQQLLRLQLFALKLLKREMKARGLYRFGVDFILDILRKRLNYEDDEQCNEILQQLFSFNDYCLNNWSYKYKFYLVPFLYENILSEEEKVRQSVANLIPFFEKQCPQVLTFLGTIIFKQFTQEQRRQSIYALDTLKKIPSLDYIKDFQELCEEIDTLLKQDKVANNHLTNILQKLDNKDSKSSVEIKGGSV